MAWQKYQQYWLWFLLTAWNSKIIMFRNKYIYHLLVHTGNDARRRRRWWEVGQRWWERRWRQLLDEAVSQVLWICGLRLVGAQWPKLANHATLTSPRFFVVVLVCKLVVIYSSILRSGDYIGIDDFRIFGAFLLGAKVDTNSYPYTWIQQRIWCSHTEPKLLPF